jgi:hypothetical protein
MAATSAIGVKIIFARKKPNFSRTGSLPCQICGLVPLNLSAYLSRMVNRKYADLANARKNDLEPLPPNLTSRSFTSLHSMGFMEDMLAQIIAKNLIISHIPDIPTINRDYAASFSLSVQNRQLGSLSPTFEPE